MQTKPCPSIQRNGYLIGVNRDSLEITHVSENCADLFEKPASALLGQPLAAVSEVLMEQVKQFLLEPVFKEYFYDSVLKRTGYFIVKHFTSTDNVMIELTPINPLEVNYLYSIDLRQLFKMPLRDEDDFKKATDMFLQAIPLYSGYEHVALYRLESNVSWSLEGEIGSHEHSFADIMASLGDECTRSAFRYVENRDAQALKVLSLPAATPLDLSHSDWRSASYELTQALETVNTRSLLCYPIVVLQKIWGMVVCFNTDVKPLHLRKIRDLYNLSSSYALSVSCYTRDEIFKTMASSKHER